MIATGFRIRKPLTGKIRYRSPEGLSVVHDVRFMHKHIAATIDRIPRDGGGVTAIAGPMREDAVSRFAKLRGDLDLAPRFYEAKSRTCHKLGYVGSRAAWNRCFTVAPTCMSSSTQGPASNRIDRPGRLLKSWPRA